MEVKTTTAEGPGTNAIDEVNELFARSFERARRGRRLARMLFVSPLVVLGVIGFFLLAAPGTMGGETLRAPAWTNLIIAVPAVAIALGLAWMWRIMRAAEDPEPARAPFRYRSRRG